MAAWARVRSGIGIALVAAAVTAVVVVWLDALVIMTEAKPPVAAVEPQAIVWGDRVFSNQDGLNAWLKAHGGDYAAWARRHPGATTIVDPVAATRHAQSLEARAHAGGSAGPERHRTALLVSSGALVAGLVVLFKTGVIRRGYRRELDTRDVLSRAVQHVRALNGDAALWTMAGAAGIVIGAAAVAIFR